MEATSAEPGSTRELILRHAARLFAARGFVGTSTRDVAAAVGIRQPSLFHHFPSKLAIAEALLEFDLAPACAFSRELRRPAGAAAVRLYRYVVWDVAYCVASPYDLRGLHGSDLLDRPELRAWRARIDELHGNLRAIVEQGVASGELVCEEPELARQVITGLSLGAIGAARGDGDDGVGGRRPALAADLVLRALLADSGRLEAVRDEAQGLAGRAPWPLGDG